MPVKTVCKISNLHGETFTLCAQKTRENASVALAGARSSYMQHLSDLTADTSLRRNQNGFLNMQERNSVCSAPTTKKRLTRSAAREIEVNGSGLLVLID